MDGVRYTRLMEVGFMAARHHDNTEYEEHFDSLGGCNAQHRADFLAAEPKTRQA